MTFEMGTALVAVSYIVIVSGFIFRMDGRIRAISERLEKVEKFHSRFVDDLLPTIHRLDGKLDTLFQLFSKKQIDTK